MVGDFTQFHSVPGPYVLQRNCLKFLSFFSIAPFSSPEQNGLSNFGRGPLKELSYQVWLKSAQWLWRKCCLKFFLFFVSIYFVQQSGNTLAILVEGHPRNISVKFF